LDKSIIIGVILSKESIELCDGALFSSLSKVNIIEHSKDFSPIKETASVDIILDEKLDN